MAASPEDVQSVFGRALDLTDPAARAAYLDAVRGKDAALHAEVVELLQAIDEASGFLARGQPTTDRPNTVLTQPGVATLTHFRGHDRGHVLASKYRLIEPIGEGGMGTVWMAEQREPVKRLVAVKLIKPVPGAHGTMARFEAERQALALMDHPNIARIFDAGAAEDGRPFFVMELVKGVPVTKFCDEHKLTPRERLALFVPVCQAVQHAHQKGVIHRDIKPGNVLVARYDEKPVPKVIDFGVAKAVGQQLTEQTLHTGFGAVVGTPEYMSPEQASFNQLDVDTRTDVYALGVLLYELLAGAPPFRRKELQIAGLMEMLRMIREVDPPKPSTKISSADALPSIAANRGTEPKALTGLVRGELDWIVMRAMEKDRRRRYDTAVGLAKDVQRYLGGDAVEAAPPSRWYRVRKLVRRNRRAAAVAAALFLALTAGVIGTTIGLIQAEAERKIATDARRAENEQLRRATEANVQAIKEKNEAEIANAKAASAKNQADEEREVAEAVVAFTREFLSQADTNAQIGQRGDPNPNLTVREVLDKAAANVLERFKGKPLVEAAIRRTIGEAYNGVGQFDKAVQQLARTADLVRPAAGTDPQAKAWQAYYDVLRPLAWAHLFALRGEKAIPLYQEILAGRERAYPADDPIVLGAVNDLAIAYAAVPNGPARRALFNRIWRAKERAYGPTHPETLTARFNLAYEGPDLAGLRDLIEPLQHLRDSRAGVRVLKGRNDEIRHTATGQLGTCYRVLGRTTEAIPLLEEFRDDLLRVEGPSGWNYLHSLEDLAEAYHRAGRTGDVAAALEKGIAGWTERAGPVNTHTLSAALGLARAYRQLGRTPEAIEVLEKCLPGCRQFFGPAAEPTRQRTELLRALLIETGRDERAEQVRQEDKAARTPPPPREPAPAAKPRP